VQSVENIFTIILNFQLSGRILMATSCATLLLPSTSCHLSHCCALCIHPCSCPDQSTVAQQPHPCQSADTPTTVKFTEVVSSMPVR